MPHTKSKHALRSEFGRLLLVPEIYPYRHDVVTPEDKNPCLGCAFQNPDDEAADGELCLKPEPVDDTCMERRIIYNHYNFHLMEPAYTRRFYTSVF